MTLTVLVAMGGPDEAAVVAGLERSADDVTVVRRCADLAELLAAAEAGLGRTALVGADLSRLDLDAVARLAAAGVAVVGVVDPADPDGAARLLRIGVRRTVPSGAQPRDVAAALAAAAGSDRPDATDGPPEPGDLQGLDGPDGPRRPGAPLPAGSSVLWTDLTGEIPRVGADGPDAAGPGPEGTSRPSGPLVPVGAGAPGGSGATGTSSATDPAPDGAGGPPTGSAGPVASPTAAGPATNPSPVARTASGGAAARPAGPSTDRSADRSEPGRRTAGRSATGRLVAVWGPTGAPGRTTLAVGLAAELAATGGTALLADADTYGPSIAQVLGLLDESAGLAAAVRAAGQGALDHGRLATLATVVTPGLRVLTGLPRTARWPELRAAGLDVVWRTCRGVADWTVVDCGFGLEADEELTFDTAAPRRNAATLSALAAADVVVAVGSADPVGIHRLVRGLADLADVLGPGSPPPVVVANRVRASAVGARPEAQVRDALARYAAVRDVHLVPDDRPALDAAMLAGRTLVESAPESPARLAVAALAASLAGVAPSMTA